MGGCVWRRFLDRGMFRVIQSRQEDVWGDDLGDATQTGGCLG